MTRVVLCTRQSTSSRGGEIKKPYHLQTLLISSSIKSKVRPQVLFSTNFYTTTSTCSSFPSSSLSTTATATTNLNRFLAILQGHLLRRPQRTPYSDSAARGFPSLPARRCQPPLPPPRPASANTRRLPISTLVLASAF